MSAPDLAPLRADMAGWMQNLDGLSQASRLSRKQGAPLFTCLGDPAIDNAKGHFEDYFLYGDCSNDGAASPLTKNFIAAARSRHAKYHEYI